MSPCAQVITAAQRTYKEKIPLAVSKSVAMFEVVNLSPEGFGLPLACAGVNGFYNSLWLMAVAPAVVLAGVFVLNAVVLLLRRKGFDRKGLELSINAFVLIPLFVSPTSEPRARLETLFCPRM